MVNGFYKGSILIILFSAMLSGQEQSANGQKPENAFANPCGPVLGIACGHTSGNVYHNDYFGFSLTFPKDWKSLPQDVIQAVHEKKAEKERSDAILQSHGKPFYIFESWDLLVISKFGLPPPPEVNSFNSNLILWADELSSSVHTLADQFEVSGFNHDADGKLLKGLTPASYSERSFLRCDRIDQDFFYHTRIVTFMRNFALGADFYSDNQQELENMIRTLDSLQFEVQPDTGSISGKLYHNQFFGFTYTLPANLDPLDDYEMRQAQLESRKEHIAEFPSSPKVHVIFFTSYNLLSATAGSDSKNAKSPNRSVRIWAEKNPFTTTPDQYFYNSTFLMDEDIEGKIIP